MSVVNGQLANQTTFNNAFMSRTAATTSTVAKVTLANTDVESGASVVNTQKAINKIYEGVGTTGEGDTTINNYSSNNYVADGDSRKTAIEKLDVGVKDVQDDINAHESAVNPHPQYLSEDAADLLYDPLGAAATVQGNLNTHVADLANPHAVTKAQVGLNNVTNDAQLKRAAGDINSFTEKTVGVDDDIVLIEDSADSYNKKKFKLSTLLGGGGGGTNFITNGSAESGTTGWTLFNGVVTASAFASTDYASVAGGHNIPNAVYDIQVKIISVSTPCGLTVGNNYYVAYASPTFLSFSLTPAGAPIDITADATITFSELRPRVPAGTSNLTFATTNTTPLIKNASFLLTKDAANRQYQGVAYDFDIDRAYQAKVLNIEIDYIVNSGTFAAGTSSTDSDVICYIYDKTNQKIIEPTSFKFLSNSSTVSDKFRGTFQTPFNSTSYRLIMLVATTSASAWALKFDGVTVTPSQYVYGTRITDWITYNPGIGITLQGTGITAATSRYRIVADTVEVAGSFVNGNATATGSILVWGLPFSVDDTKQPAPIAGFRNDGSAFYNQTAVSVLCTGQSARFINPVTVDFYQASGIAANAKFSFVARYPALGFSASTQMSDYIDTKNVGLTARKTATQSIPSGGSGAVITNWPAGYTDTNGAFDPVTGIYTIRTSGRYRVTGALAWAGATGGFRIVDLIKNVSTPLNSNFLLASNTNTLNHEVSYEGDFIGGDTIKLNAFQNSGSALNIDNSVTAGGSARLHVSSVSNNQTISAAETVCALYTGGPPTGTLNGSLNVVTFGTRVKDSFGSYNSGEYKPNVSGTFDISAQVRIGGTYSTGTGFGIAIFIDGVSTYIKPFTTTGSSSDVIADIHVKAIPLLAGQSVTIRAYSAATTPSYISSSASNFFSISRSGSY